MGGETVSSNQCLVFVKQRPAVVCTLHLAAFSQTYASSQDSAKKMCVFHIMEARQACLRPGKDLRTEKLVGITLRLGKYLDESVLLQTHFFLFPFILFLFPSSQYPFLKYLLLSSICPFQQQSLFYLDAGVFFITRFTLGKI